MHPKRPSLCCRLGWRPCATARLPLSPQAAVATMEHFQAAQRRHISAGLSLEQLCAVVNNNVRCYDESLEFAEGLEERLDDALKGGCGEWGGGGELWCEACCC